MEESSVLLSYFPSNVEATEAFNRLRRAAVWKTVQIQSSANGRVSVAGRAERTIRWRWSFAFLLVGLVISLVGQLLLNSFKLGWQQALVSLGFSVAFGFLGWLIARIRYPGVSSGFIDKYARWLVNEESLVLIEGSTRSLESLVPILEGEGDVSPTAFIIPPALDQLTYRMENGSLSWNGWIGQRL
jgi:hypothetical protein